MVVLKLPLSWKKLKGGNQIEWIGYALDMKRFQLGVTALRAGAVRLRAMFQHLESCRPTPTRRLLGSWRVVPPLNSRFGTLDC